MPKTTCEIDAMQAILLNLERLPGDARSVILDGINAWIQRIAADPPPKEPTRQRPGRSLRLVPGAPLVASPAGASGIRLAA